RGELHRVAAVQREERLHQPLAERRFANDHRAIVVLQRAGHDLRGRGGTLVNEDHQRNFGGDGAFARHVQLGRGTAAAHARDLLALRQEQVADGECLLQEAARVAAKVQQNARGALIGECLYGSRYFLGRRLIEALQTYVTHAIVQLERVRYGRNVDDCAGEVHLDGLGHALTGESNLHLGAGLAGERLGHSLGRPFARIEGIVNLDDDVTLDDAALLRGRVREHLAHGYAPVGNELDLHAESAVASAGVLLELLELFGGVQFAVRVLEFIQESARGLLVEGAGVNGIHEPLGYQRQDLVEQNGAVPGDAILKNEAPGEGGDQEQPCEGQEAGSTHEP